MRSLVELRLRELSGTRLSDFLTSDGALRSLSPTFERALHERREPLLAELRDERIRRRLGAFLGRTTREFLEQQSPFLEIESPHRRVIAAVYAALLQEIARCLALSAAWPEVAEALRGVFAEHQDRLRVVIAALLRDAGVTAEDRPQISAEYSPELQLRVLGVRAEDLRAPILDLGCGAGAALVHHLRALGHAPVWGLDRSAPAGHGFLRRSWLEGDLTQLPWQTVIAHQSFSLHFIHAHVHSERHAARFAARYVEILRALAPGGRFLYAPGLSFIEALLPEEEFAVSVQPIPDSTLFATSVRRLR